MGNAGKKRANCNLRWGLMRLVLINVVVGGNRGGKEGGGGEREAGLV